MSKSSNVQTLTPPQSSPKRGRSSLSLQERVRVRLYPSSLWTLSSTREEDAEEGNILGEQINKLNIFIKLAKIDI
jgi:hypothetical protein